MTEYGYKQSDRRIGTFYFRITKEELMAIDNTYGKKDG
jgi:hypothetical protein